MDVHGIPIPDFLYGTAWKEEQTELLTGMALSEGFRGIDTANQRKHYFEAAVGDAIRIAFDRGQIKRQDLFLQTKFTFSAGQDHRLPYDARSPVAEQVKQSFASSLEHLGTDYIDSYILHGPARRQGLGPEDWDAWHAMESLYDSGRARLLGVSNVTIEQLQELCQNARISPTFVQNRCYAALGWDRLIRDFCSRRQMIYQGFSLLTANRELLQRPELIQIAQQHRCTSSQIVFRFARDIGMLPLTGTTSAVHMRQDLATSGFRLTTDEIQRIEAMRVP